MQQEMHFSYWDFKHAVQHETKEYNSELARTTYRPPKDFLWPMTEILF
jgi:hypothetical protein